MSSDGKRERPDDHTGAGPGCADPDLRARQRLAALPVDRDRRDPGQRRVLGLETYPGIERDHGTLPHDLDKACLAVSSSPTSR